MTLRNQAQAFEHPDYEGDTNRITDDLLLR